jgi:hypothetical protein
MFRSVWPVEDRPEEMQVEEWFNQMTTDYIFSMKRIWDEKKKKDDKGEETFKRDAALPTRQYDGGPDNCTDLLHPARYDLSRTGFTQLKHNTERDSMAGTEQDPQIFLHR